MASTTAALACSHNRGRGVSAMTTNNELGSAKVIRKLTRLFTSLLSTTLNRPAPYPNKRPTKMGTSALARTWIIFDSLLFQPLCCELGADQNGGLTHFTRGRGFESIAKIDGLSARILDGCDQFALYVSNLLPRGFRWIFDVKQFVQKAQLRVIPNVVRHGGDLLRELLKFVHGAPRDTCRRFLMHCMDHDATVVERQNSIGLVAMGEESSRQCMANHQSNYGVTRESCRAVSVCSSGSGKKDSGSF